MILALIIVIVGVALYTIYRIRKANRNHEPLYTSLTTVDKDGKIIQKLFNLGLVKDIRPLNRTKFAEQFSFTNPSYFNNLYCEIVFMSPRWSGRDVTVQVYNDYTEIQQIIVSKDITATPKPTHAKIFSTLCGY